MHRHFRYAPWNRSAEMIASFHFIPLCVIWYVHNTYACVYVCLCIMIACLSFVFKCIYLPFCIIYEWKMLRRNSNINQIQISSTYDDCTCSLIYYRSLKDSAALGSVLICLFHKLYISWWHVLHLFLILDETCALKDSNPLFSPKIKDWLKVECFCDFCHSECWKCMRKNH